MKAGGGSPLRGGAGAGQQPVQVVIKDSPIILAQVSVHLNLTQEVQFQLDPITLFRR